MGYIIGRASVLRSDLKHSKMNYTRITFPIENIKADRYFEHFSNEQMQEMSSAEFRKYMREKCRLPVRDRQGNPYAYRVYWSGGDKGLRTYFPKTKAGEKMSIHGRLDYETMVAQLQQARNQQGQ